MISAPIWQSAITLPWMWWQVVTPGTADETSFVSLLITEGEGRLTCGGETVQAKKGDSFFITAGSGAYALTGSCKALLTTV